MSLLLSRMTLPDKINMVTGAGNIPAIPRLCIPAINLQDGPNGVGDGLTGVTQLPAGVSLAATWDRSLAAEYGKVIGAEERGKGKMVNLGPTVNIDRDPRWGRSFEAYTEDPYLNAAITVPVIDGVQSQGVMSQVKHFAVYNQETNRNTPADNAIVSTRALHEIYLPAFWAATQRAKAASVMCSYSTVNGQAACQNRVPAHHHPQAAVELPRVRGFRLQRHPLHSGLRGRRAGPGDAGRRLLRPGAGDGGEVGPGRRRDGEPDGDPDPDRDVPVQRLQQPAGRLGQRDRDHPGAPGGVGLGGRGGHGAAEERPAGRCRSRRRAGAAWR